MYSLPVFSACYQVRITCFWNTKRVIYIAASKCSSNHSISETHKTVQSFKLNLLPAVSLSNYKCLSATVKVLETFLEAILWKPFQLFRRIVNEVSSITKVQSLQRRFQSREQIKLSWSQVRIVWGMALVLSRCSYAKKSFTKGDRCAGALLWRRNQMLILHISGRFLLTASLRRWKMSVDISWFTTAIPVHFTS
jgi:hypothetical protein